MSDDSAVGANLKKLTLLVVAIASMAGSKVMAAGTYNSTNSVASPQVSQQSSSQTATQISSRISQAVSGATGGTGATGGFGSGGGTGGGTGGFGSGGGTGGTGGGSGVGGSSQGSSLDDGVIGRSAGSADKAFGLWFNVGTARASDTHAFESFHGTIATFVGGADYRVNDKMLVGMAVGYEMARITTTFNNGAMTADNAAIAPYFGYSFNDYLSLDATVGYAFVNYGLARNSGAIKGSTDGGRVFSSTNITAHTSLDNWQLSSGLGYLYLLEHQGSYTEVGAGGNAVSAVNIRLGQLRSVNKIGYLEKTEWGSIMPYLLVRPEYDVSKTPASLLDAATSTKATGDRFGTTFGLGLGMNIGDDSSVTLEGTTSQFRRYLGMDGLSGTIRLAF